MVGVLCLGIVRRRESDKQKKRHILKMHVDGQKDRKKERKKDRQINRQRDRRETETRRGNIPTKPAKAWTDQ
jgi:hypothetical protein